MPLLEDLHRFLGLGQAFSRSELRPAGSDSASCTDSEVFEFHPSIASNAREDIFLQGSIHVMVSSVSQSSFSLEVIEPVESDV